MKKQKVALNKDYNYLIVFLDDLKEIEELFKKHGSGDIYITTNGYEYESIEELTTHLSQQKIKNIELSVHDPLVYLDINRSSNRLYSSANCDSSIAVFHNINDILSKCQPKMSWLYNDKLLIFISILGVLLSPFVAKIPENYISIVSVWFLLYCYYIFRVIFFRPSKILLINRHTQKNFFQRNKDKLILSLITVILTILGTLLVQKYLLK